MHYFGFKTGVNGNLSLTILNKDAIMSNTISRLLRLLSIPFPKRHTLLARRDLGAANKMHGDRLKADVLYDSGGIAGLMAAKRAGDFGQRALV